MEKLEPQIESAEKGDRKTAPSNKNLRRLVLGLLIFVLLGVGGWAASTLVFPNFTGLGGLIESDLTARGDEYVRLDQTPSDLVSGLIAVEDKRFYTHDGTDWIRVGGALWANAKAQRVVEGGSTITEQLVDNTVLRDQQKSLPRKIQAMLLTRWVEHAYTKNQILEYYLNAVYYGPDSYGIDAASRRYFGQPPSRLDPMQQHFLAGVVQGPALYDPSSQCSAARTRLDAVIDARLSAQTLSAAEAEDLKATSLVHVGGTCRA
ncbi:MAG TPA: biosynthetic peptidoglycan transglycosylase [Rubrobacteraceae bacterium]|nr:biosynthetic peptidoglycan transglycosylase [Rubrobacteraceae bacterium]